MRIMRSREELARYAADNDIHSITGVMLECDDLEVTATPAEVSKRIEAGEIDTEQSLWGIRNWGADNKPLDQFIEHLNSRYQQRVTSLMEDICKERSSQEDADTPAEDLVKTLIELIPGQFQFNERQNTVTDIRHARLIRRMDLTEWVSIPYKDILYWVVTEGEGDMWRFPLGRITVWIRGGAQVDHTRTKTAKSFIRGEIAQQMSERDFDTSLEGIQRVFFDVNAEDAFSTNWGNC